MAFDTLRQIADARFWDIGSNDKNGLDFLHNDCTLSVSLSGEQVVGLIKELMCVLSDDQRLGLMGNYCKACGTDDLPCHCWNDE